MSGPNDTEAEDRNVTGGAWPIARSAAVAAAATCGLALARIVLNGSGDPVGWTIGASSLGFALAAVLASSGNNGRQRIGMGLLPLFGALGIFGMAAIENGLYSESLPWAPFVPMLTQFCLPKRAAIGATLLVLLLPGALLVMHLTGAPHLPEAPAIELWLRWFGTEGALLFGAAVAVTFQRWRTLSLKNLQAQQAAVREREIRLRSTIDTAVDGIITLDESGHIETANPAVQKLFGHAPSDIIGASAEVLLLSPLAGELTQIWRNVSGRPNNVEVTGIRADTSTFPVELGVSEFYLDGVRHFTGVMRDISERKKVERLQSEFISTVSHELRTPLTSIRGSLGLLLGGALGEMPAQSIEYLNIATSNSNRLIRLINDILDIEKMQSGTMRFELANTDLAAAVRGAIAANGGFAEAHDVTLATGNIAEGHVLADRDRLTQALTNLISNAAKFSPAGGQVDVSSERRDDWFRVAIRDRGPGIPKEFEDRIFQRFAQADGSSTRAKGGTGLGLSITKIIVEKLHGRVGFLPADGGGTVFFIELPANDS